MTEYDSENKHLDVKTPSLFTMLKNFTRDISKYIANGAQNVTEEDYAERLDTCLVCPHIQKEKMKCGLCGCLLEHKAKWKTTVCPDKPSRWETQYIDEKGQKGNNTNSSN